MSKSYAVVRDPRDVAHHAEVCARILGSQIRSTRLRDGRSLEELAPKAGLTVPEWESIERGELEIALEQVLMFAMVLGYSRSWVRYLTMLWSKAWGQQ